MSVVLGMMQFLMFMLIVLTKLLRIQLVESTFYAYKYVVDNFPFKLTRFYISLRKKEMHVCT